MLFADKGTMATSSIVNVDNKQYFLSNGIFALEQVGELNQIRLGSEISKNIKNEFNNFDTALKSKSNLALLSLFRKRILQYNLDKRLCKSLLVQKRSSTKNYNCLQFSFLHSNCRYRRKCLL